MSIKKGFLVGLISGLIGFSGVAAGMGKAMGKAWAYTGDLDYAYGKSDDIYLTKKADYVKGTGFSDSVVGILSSPSMTGEDKSTLNPSDLIEGNGGEDELYIDVAGDRVSFPGFNRDGGILGMKLIRFFFENNCFSFSFNADRVFGTEHWEFIGRGTGDLSAFPESFIELYNVNVSGDVDFSTRGFWGNLSVRLEGVMGSEKDDRLIFGVEGTGKGDVGMGCDSVVIEGDLGKGRDEVIVDASDILNEDGNPSSGRVVVNLSELKGYEASFLKGSENDDSLKGGAGADEIHGGKGADVLEGMGGNDLIYGEKGDDVLAGGSGDDELIGGDGNDVIKGGAGNDVLEGGAGDDRLDGGEGSDIYVIGKGFNRDRDEIADSGRGRNDIDVVLFEESADFTSVSGKYNVSTGWTEGICRVHTGMGIEKVYLDDKDGKNITVLFETNQVNGERFDVDAKGEGKAILRIVTGPEENDFELSGIRASSRVWFIDIIPNYLTKRIVCSGGRDRVLYGESVYGSFVYSGIPVYELEDFEAGAGGDVFDLGKDILEKGPGGPGAVRNLGTFGGGDASYHSLGEIDDVTNGDWIVVRDLRKPLSPGGYRMVEINGKAGEIWDVNENGRIDEGDIRALFGSRAGYPLHWERRIKLRKEEGVVEERGKLGSGFVLVYDNRGNAYLFYVEVGKKSYVEEYNDFGERVLKEVWTVGSSDPVVLIAVFRNVGINAMTPDNFF